MTEFDLVILGDGIVARSLALVCAQAHITYIRIAPREKAYENDPRSYAISSESRRFLDQLGLNLGDGDMVRKIEVGFGEKLQAPLIKLGDGTPLMHMFDHRILAKALDQGELIDAEAGQIDLSDKGVALLDHNIRAKLLIIAEGKDAQNARTLGISYTNQTYAQQAITAKLRATQPHHQTARQLFTPFGPIGILPHGTHDLSIVWSQDQARANWLLRLSDSGFVAELEKLIGSLYGALSLTSQRAAFPLAHSQPSRLTGSHLLLAGDSAHVIHPMMGQGLNLGFRDAITLQKLLLTQKRLGLEIGSGELLQDYSKARRADIEKLSLMTKGLHLLGRSSNPLTSKARQLATAMMGSENAVAKMLSDFLKDAI